MTGRKYLKDANSKFRKPLAKQRNPGIAKKAEMIRRTKIKKEYYKLLKTEGLGQNESQLEEKADIFSSQTEERTHDALEGYSSDQKEKLYESANDTSESDSEKIDKADVPKSLGKTRQSQKREKKSKRPAKPNPFGKLIVEAERKKAERQAAIEESKRLKEEQNQKRKEYYAKRNDVRDKLQRKTRKGQPVMANQVLHLLEKIQGMK
ncbi:uncharacterized protein SPPG_01882 [Spizellomyces punctatus DAOM BR117]|uniref:rRNA-processing protein FYV7 n=1 Tax=Spizellomyces punctatus (strain DAOM BR117) TaxID=645134 RepID=A0A0L0HN04_SPIPD|nr:uncharacterized protein SPPG_01882 [Spizellomyces punctatus DAOM BR117]KND02801.1 hypothetical protein SPPG_01882 [Spizellomyces punctatus DAOM BR117]|eukprot:XP_016610840.1 hypothetical protein SPPG_01882 [Spizellomyces punctatus DAOM BR117]